MSRMSKHEPQSEGMKALEQSLNDHMEICCLRRKVKRLKAEVKRFKAEVERLSKAGDAMDRALTTYAGNMKDNCFQCQLDWLAAKEGKQP
jgi:predicted RNase H-like nuclease (RuvC/YqgF family)